jgi:hypothetical protein
VIARIKDSFNSGISRLKWFSTIFAERVHIELAVMKLLYMSRETERKKEELLRNMGARIYELRDNPDRAILKDRIVLETVEAVEKLEKEMKELKRKAEEMSSVSS